jgi:hypothetical protein
MIISSGHPRTSAEAIVRLRSGVIGQAFRVGRVEECCPALKMPTKAVLAVPISAA